MGTREKTIIANATFDWCIANFGTPLKRALPNLTISTDRRYKRRFGDYADREIVVYLNVTRTKTSLIKTIIHEYTHFLQMPRFNDIDKYNKLMNDFDYKNHPWEIEASEAEKIFFSACYYDLKKKKIV